MSRRTVALVVSVILAAVAAVALLSYVDSLKDEAFKGAKTVEVFVAKETIPVGTTGEAAASGLIERTTIPQKVVAEGAISTLDQLKGKVAGVTILKGEQIVAPRFVTPGQVRGQLPIPNGKVAMSVQVGIPPGVANFVQVGSHISILASLSVPKKGGGAQAASEQRVQYLLQDVEVLQVGQRTITVTQGQQGAQTTQSEGQVLATLALTPAQAEKLGYAILVGGTGNLYFTLLPENEHRSTGTPGRTKDNAFK
jgi:pilus assembly protein CpaB